MAHSDPSTQVGQMSALSADFMTCSQAAASAEVQRVVPMALAAVLDKLLR